MKFISNGHSLRYNLLMALTALAMAVFTIDDAAAGPALKVPPVKNIIVMICDGWSIDHIQAASYFRYGKDSGQIYHRFPFRFYMSTFAYDEDYRADRAWRRFDYVMTRATDSAAAATTMSTGVKTRQKSIGVGPSGKKLTHALEAAENRGKATGVVTSVPFSDATPAGFMVHNKRRINYKKIARAMIYRSTAEVIMGCGHPCYSAAGAFNDCNNSFIFVGGVSTWADLTDSDGARGADADRDGIADSWHLVQTRKEFQALMAGDTPKRVIGIPQVYQTLQYERAEAGRDSLPFATPLVEEVPRLEEMARAALNILDNDPDGLFLVIEGGAVDWASHDNDSARMIEEQVDFDNAVQAVVEWVESRSDWRETLVIVTGDHETGYLTGPDSGESAQGPVWNPVVNNGAGILPGMEWHSDDHTNRLIPLFAKGQGANLLGEHTDKDDPVRGPYLDNRVIGSILLALLGAN